jgi:hypothetical protein
MAVPLLALIPLLAPLVPRIAEWIAGDDAGEVAAQVTSAVTAVAGSTDPATVAAVIADPSRAGDLAERLARIGAERERVLEEQRTARMAAALADVAGARQQTVALAQAGSRIAWAAPVMSVVIATGFFGCVAMVFLVERVWDERTVTVLNTLLGAMTIAFGQVCNYWLGSSRGSAAKEEARAAESTIVAAAVQAAPTAVRSILRRTP